MVVMFTAPAMAEDWVNPMQGPEWCPECVPVHWSQMGSFNGDVWTWNEQFRNGGVQAPDDSGPIIGFCEWNPANPCDFEELWRPTKGIQITEARFTYRNYPDIAPQTELALNAGLSIKFPEVWMVPPDSQHNPPHIEGWFWMGGLMPPDGSDWNDPYLQNGQQKCAEDFPQYANKDFSCDEQYCGEQDGVAICADFSPDGNLLCGSASGAAEWPCETGLEPHSGPKPPCNIWWDAFAVEDIEGIPDGCRPQKKAYMLTESLEPLTNDRIVSVVWSKTKLPMPFWNCMTNASYEYIDYDTNWRQNIWTSRAVYGPGTGYGPEIRYRVSNITPDLGLNSFLVTYDTDKTLEFEIDVHNVDPMPVVPTQITQTEYVEVVKKKKKDDNEGDDKKKKKKNKSGKPIKVRPEDVIVDNITTRFLDNGALVIQWPEPDGALMGGMQLRLFIGNDTINPETGCNDEDFLWINSPAQIGTIVITDDIWEPFKQKTLDRDPNATEILARFMYRDNHDSGPGLIYMNRGYSGPFSIPVN